MTLSSVELVYERPLNADDQAHAHHLLVAEVVSHETLAVHGHILVPNIRQQILAVIDSHLVSLSGERRVRSVGRDE